MVGDGMGDSQRLEAWTVLNSLRPSAFGCSLQKPCRAFVFCSAPEFYAPCNSTAILLIKCEQPERTGVIESWLAGLMYRAALLAVAGHPIAKQILPLLHMAFLCSQTQTLLEYTPTHTCIFSIIDVTALHPSQQSPSMSLKVLQPALLTTACALQCPPAACWSESAPTKIWHM